MTTSAAAARRRKKKFDALVVGGGGVKGVAALGAVRELVRAGIVDDVRTCVGTSVGAVIAAIVALGLDPDDVMTRAAAEPFEPRVDLGTLGASFGLDDASLRKWLGAMGFGDATLADVPRVRGVRLVVCATDVATRRAVYLSDDTAPDMRVADALRASCSVPFVFAAVRHGGMVLVDGCLTDNFPLRHAIDVERAARPLGVTTSRVGGPGSVDGFESFVLAVLESAICDAAPPPDATVLDVVVPGHVTAASFGLPRAELRGLYRAGASQGLAFAKKTL